MGTGAISQNEEKKIREWLRSQHQVRVPQQTLWRERPEEAIKILKDRYPQLKTLTAADIERAAGR
jgi:flagellar motor switch protein FliG